MQFPTDEDREQHSADGEPTDGDTVAPAQIRRFDDGVEDDRQTGDGECGTEGIETGSLRILRGRDEHESGEHTDEHDRQVHQEHRSPGEVLQQDPTGERTEHRAEATHAGPDPDGTRSLVHREHIGDDRQCGGHDQRTPDAHAGPGDHERASRGREGGGDGRTTEDREPDLQCPAATETIAETARGQQQTGEHQGVGVNDPLQVTRGGVEVLLDGGQGHVEDRQIQHRQHEAEAKNGEDDPPAVEGSLLDTLGATRHRSSLPKGWGPL